MTRADLLPHWPGCGRYLVHTRRHDDDTRTRCCFTCGGMVRLDGNGRILSAYRPTDPPVWAHHHPEEDQ